MHLTDEHGCSYSNTLSLSFRMGLRDLSSLLLQYCSVTALRGRTGHDGTGHVTSQMQTQTDLDAGEEGVQVGWIKVSSECYIAY